MMTKVVWLLAMIVGMGSGNISAQLLLPGSITGSVSDQTGVALHDVVIELASEDGKTKFATRTDQFGAYSFSGLEPGRYQMRLVAPEGFIQESAMSVCVEPHWQSTVNLQPKVSAPPKIMINEGGTLDSSFVFNNPKPL